MALASGKKAHWLVLVECKLGLVHRWQAAPHSRTEGKGIPVLCSHMAMLHVLAIPWLCIAQRYQTCGIVCQMELGAS